MSLWLIPATHGFRNFPTNNVYRVRSAGSHSAHTYRFLLAWIFQIEDFRLQIAQYYRLPVSTCANLKFTISNLQSQIYNQKCPALSSPL